MRFLLTLFSCLMLVSFESCQAQERQFDIQVTSEENHSEILDATITVISSEGEEKEFITTGDQLTILLNCDEQYIIECNKSTFHKEKLKIEHPCRAEVENTIKFMMKSNVISH